MNAILFKHFNEIFNFPKAFHHHGTGVIDIEKVSLCHTQDKIMFIIMESFFIHFLYSFSFLFLSYFLLYLFLFKKKRRKTTWKGHIMSKENSSTFPCLFFFFCVFSISFHGKTLTLQLKFLVEAFRSSFC